MIPNPYTPGAGFMPAYLAGREHLLDSAEGYLLSIQRRYPQQSVIYYGLRGVGKTVLLNAIELTADNYQILYTHIEAGEDKQFTQRLLGALNKFTHAVSAKETARDFGKKCLALLRSFSLTYDLAEKTVGVEVQTDGAFSTGIFSEDLTEIFVTLGKAALQSGDTICLFIDEMQYLTEEEISGVVMALHRCNQLRLPVMLFGAGLPKILKVIGEACSYTERLFKFEVVDKLSAEEAKAAMVNPAAEFAVSYDEAAVQQIFDITNGYPYFIQEFCSILWGQKAKEQKAISQKDVMQTEGLFFQTLDEGFFALRYNRCTNREKEFMTAMVRCGSLPCSISHVAKEMKKSVSSVSPIRGKLISKGMIYPTGHAEIDFTVPQFDCFIKRVNPELQI